MPFRCINSPIVVCIFEKFQVEGDLNGIEPINDCPVSDFSVTCPSNTVFLSDLKYSSTPNVELRGENTVKEVFESETRFAPKLSCGSLMRGDTMLRKPFLLAHSNGGQFVNHGRDLSAISETSREYKSSSSSGASSGATSHFKSHMLR